MATTRQLINKYIALGYDIKYVERKEGGVRVKSFEGQKFKGSQGNTYLRKLANAPLSQYQQIHIKEIENKIDLVTNKKIKHVKNKKPPLPKELANLLKQAQKEWNKLGRSSDKIAKGRLKTARVRWKLEHSTYEETKQALLRQIEYGRGYAYIGEVQAILDFLNKNAYKHSNINLIQLINRITALKDKFYQTWVQPIMNIIYDFDNITEGGIPITDSRINTLVNNINAILNNVAKG